MDMGRVTRLCAVAVVVSACTAAAAPGPALAGTVAARPLFTYGDQLRLVYEAAPAERNDVQIRTSTYLVEIRDPAGVTAGAWCRGIQGDSTLAVCELDPRTAPLRMFGAVEARLGDGDDAATVHDDAGPIDARLDGGEGNDRLIGGRRGPNLLVGGPGDDTMAGGSVSDLFDQGAQLDGSDRMSGGEGHDWVDYRGRRGAVRADLEGDRDDGEIGERDQIDGDVEVLHGGQGADQLRGGAGNDFLFGGPGRDLLQGAAGNDSLNAPSSPTLVPEPALRSERTGDRLDGGPGADFLEGDAGGNRLVGGPGPDVLQGRDGADRIETKDGGTDEVHCAGGKDRLRQDRLDYHYGCDRTERQPSTPVPYRLAVEFPLSPTAVPFVDLRVGCPGAFVRRCRGTVTLEIDGAEVAGDTLSDNRDVFDPRLTEDQLARIQARDPRVRVVVKPRGRRGRTIRRNAAQLPSSAPELPPPSLAFLELRQP
jgi:hypothetical protein